MIFDDETVLRNVVGLFRSSAVSACMQVTVMNHKPLLSGKSLPPSPWIVPANVRSGNTTEEFISRRYSRPFVRTPNGLDYCKVALWSSMEYMSSQHTHNMDDDVMVGWPYLLLPWVSILVGVATGIGPPGTAQLPPISSCHV